MDFLFAVNIIALLFSFFVIGLLLGVAFSKPIRKQLVKILRLERVILFRKRLTLDKVPQNPILRPGTHPWTAEAVMNPAAAVIHGRTHLVFRAIGIDGVSRLGYASSADGILFDDIVPYPIYVARSPRFVTRDRRIYSPVLYPSGGSWGGCEDPRMVVVDGWVYVTFNVFEQNWAMRVAVISMRVEDFLAKRFHLWQGPLMLSANSTNKNREKNWVLFPDKIGGKFALLHGIIDPDNTRARVEYADTVEEFSLRRIVTIDPQKVPDSPISWHVHVRSAGPPPIKTERGWLVLYHAHDAAEPSRYKVGAMLLDLTDPTHILHRAIAPIISPDATYENDGKPGVVYVCGAVVRDGVLYVYYGGADKVVCVATTHLNSFVDAIIAGNHAELELVEQTQTTPH